MSFDVPNEVPEFMRKKDAEYIGVKLYRMKREYTSKTGVVPNKVVMSHTVFDRLSSNFQNIPLIPQFKYELKRTADNIMFEMTVTKIAFFSKVAIFYKKEYEIIKETH